MSFYEKENIEVKEKNKLNNEWVWQGKSRKKKRNGSVERKTQSQDNKTKQNVRENSINIYCFAIRSRPT